MVASHDQTRLGKVRLRLGDRRVLVVPTYSADSLSVPPTLSSMLPGSPPIATPPQAVPVISAPNLVDRLLVALIEAVPARAELLAATMLTTLEASGSRCAAISLEPQNRLALRFGCSVQSAPHAWELGAEACGVQQGHRLTVSAPSAEDAVESHAVSTVITQIRDRADLTVVDLGCRWVPRLFRPVLAQATHIWIIARAGQWSGVEMRLEQAELSGWAPMHKVRLVVIGEEPPLPAHLSGSLAGTLREPEGQGVRELMGRELRRVGT